MVRAPYHFTPSVKEVHEKFSSKWERIPYLRDFPLEQAWRLCVDGRYQKDHGPEFIVDDEPSFLAGTEKLLNIVLNGLCIDGLNFDEHSPKILTAEYYQQLHDIAIEGTYRKVWEGGKKEEFKIGYAPRGRTGFGWVQGSNFSKAGRLELQQKIDCRKGGQMVGTRYGGAGHPVGNCIDMQNPVSNLEHATKSMTPEERLEIARTIINKYHREIRSAKMVNDEDAKLTAIVRCCQDLDQAHLFSDANIRTIAFGVLPKLLLENGFPPCILPNPNILDGFSVEEIKDAIRKGQETFQSWCEQNMNK